LYIPSDIHQAYENGTRSFDGKPGPNYWQNGSDYNIKVELEPTCRRVTGEETVTYYNNSPDTLKRVVIRLYQDLYKKGNKRDMEISSGDIHDGVDIERLSINGQDVDLKTETPSFSRSGTNLILTLPDSLRPRTSIAIGIAWSFVLPNESRIRMGSYDESSFLVAYWYPQISVYDDVDGWDRFDYTGSQEFYNDFCNFDVEITVPGGYVVWATGVLQNPEQVLAGEHLRKYHEAQTSDNIVNIIQSEDYEAGNVTVDGDKNTWRFKAKYVPDFTFAVSDHYLWDATSVVVDSLSTRRVLVAAAYKKESDDFREVVEIGRKVLEYLSQELPGVPFPYPEITVFNGSGGMEFPMMVNDGSSSRRSSTVHVTSHEITHTYFPFYMGINERKYGWMDEGWAVMIPFEIQNRLEPSYDPITRIVQRYSNSSGRELEVPVMTPTIVFGGNVYRPALRTATYQRPSIAYHFLRDLLGKDLFSKAMKEYISRWNGKHPLPYDFFFTFNDAAEEDLGWFWRPWFFEPGYPDLAIKEVAVDSDRTRIVVERRGNIPVPVFVKMTFTDGQEDTLYETCRAWSKGEKLKTFTIESATPIKQIELGNSQIPDINLDDNRYDFAKENDHLSK
jgi:hypothetical protein